MQNFAVFVGKLLYSYAYEKEYHVGVFRENRKFAWVSLVIMVVQSARSAIYWGIQHLVLFQ